MHTVTVNPSAPRCAGIQVLVEDGVDMIYMTAGESPPFEIELNGHSYKSLAGTEEFTEILRAAAEGRFEEQIWRSKEGIVKSVGRIEVKKGEPVVVKYRRRLLRSSRCEKANKIRAIQHAQPLASKIDSI